MTVQADHALGPTTVKLLDRHRVPLATKQQAVKQGDNVFAFHKKSKVGAVYLQIGAFRDWVVGDSYGQISAAWGKLSESDE